MRPELNAVKSAIINHFTNTHHKRTEQQLEREKWLVPRLIPFSRYCLMPAAVLIQVCTGSIYAWSGFNLAIEERVYGSNHGIDRAIAVNVFYVALAVLASSAAFLGPWLERAGPFKGALLGACFFYFGNLMTALGIYTQHMPLVFVGYGVFGGVGLGISYISPVSPLQKWFPEIRGVAAGLAVAGFGAGSIFSPYTQKALMSLNYGRPKSESHSLELTFIILGSCYFVIMAVSSMVMRMPPPGYEVKGITIHTVKGAERRPETTMQTEEDEQIADLTSHFSMNLVESLSSPEYWMIYFMFLGSQITGLLIISKVQPIIRNQFNRSADEAAKINSILGGVNLLGRLTLPLLSDLIKARRILFALSLSCQAVCLGCLPSALETESYAGVLVCIFMIGYFYGAGFGMIPAFLADQFGAKNVGATHGLILTAAWVIAGVGGGFIFTAVYNSQSKIHASLLQWYTLDFQWILAPVLFSFLLCLFIPCDLCDRRLPRVPNETFRFRMLHLPLVRVIGWRPQIVTTAQRQVEWQAYLATVPNGTAVDKTDHADVRRKSNGHNGQLNGQFDCQSNGSAAVLEMKK